MWDLYWLTRLDMISGWSVAMAIVTGLLTLVVIIAYFVIHFDYLSYNHEDDKRWSDFWKKLIKRFAPCFVIALIFSILTPTSKEAYLIYGIGGTIDYVRNDSTTVQLPHKCIEAIDIWLDKEITNTTKNK